MGGLQHARQRMEHSVLVPVCGVAGLVVSL